MQLAIVQIDGIQLGRIFCRSSSSLCRNPSKFSIQELSVLSKIRYLISSVLSNRRVHVLIICCTSCCK